MNDLSMNLRGYRRVTPLSASTLSWLNSSGALSQAKRTADATRTCTLPKGGAKPDATRVRAGAGANASETRLSEAVLNAAHAVNRHYTDLLTSRRSRPRMRQDTEV